MAISNRGFLIVVDSVPGLAYWKEVVVGVYTLWSVAESSQNRKRKVRPEKTEGEN